ncbi:MAG TPA: hypothetical protein VLF88_01150, partial [Candidatus Babeliales bacterium]|nr:hypothetical protein [Candidatus Babeliales bacterium]
SPTTRIPEELSEEVMDHKESLTFAQQKISTVKCICFGGACTAKLAPNLPRTEAMVGAFSYSLDES